MNIFLLGNGYDLHHNFPTRYIDFLNVVDFIIENEGTTFSTVGEVFSNPQLQDKNKFIKDAYEKHSRIYDDVNLNQEEFKQMLELAKKNIWFKYFNETRNKELCWIDFEKEIAVVINAFENFFEKIHGNSDGVFVKDNIFYFDISKYPENAMVRFIIKKFNFFFEKDNSSDAMFATFSGGDLQKIHKSYCIEQYVGSKCFALNFEKIVSELYDSLRELSQILKLYLKLFIETPTKRYNEMGIKAKCRSWSKADRVVTFNYTNTYEKLYGNTSSIYHIHGKVKEYIILGVNPDEKDELSNIDTMFVCFKKYFQRVYHKTDLKYLREFHEITEMNNFDCGNVLNVIGHSLDITDKDIIAELFYSCRKINIWYHEKSVVASYIKNLVEIFGKKEFDKIRREKELEFLPQAEIEWKYPKL